MPQKTESQPDYTVVRLFKKSKSGRRAVKGATFLGSVPQQLAKKGMFKLLEPNLLLDAFYQYKAIKELSSLDYSCDFYYKHLSYSFLRT